MDSRCPLNIGTTISENGKEYKIGEVLGRGATSIVYEGKDTSGYGRVIIKECYPKDLRITRDVVTGELKSSTDSYAKFLEAVKDFDEMRALVLMLHDKKGLTNFSSTEIAYIKDKNTRYLVTDIRDGMTYGEFLKTNKDSLTLRDIVAPVYYLTHLTEEYHKNGFLLLDIKKDNFYVTDIGGHPNNIQLFDVGSIKKKEQMEEGFLLTYSEQWAAPELRKRDISKIDERTDVYGLGAVLFDAVMGRYPMVNDFSMPHVIYDFDSALCPKCVRGTKDNPEIRELLKEILSHTVVAYKGKRYQSTKKLAEKLRDLMDILSMNDAEQREFSDINRRLDEWHERLRRVETAIEDHGTRIGVLEDQMTDVQNIMNNSDLFEQVDSLPVSTNRFRYNSNSTNFHGREAELQYLVDMCESDRQFCWVGLCGAGGTGKSRLAYELCSKMIKLQWKVFAPMRFDSHDQKKIWEALNNKKRNVLICLDYIKQDKDGITVFIKQIIDNLYINNVRKIRIVLIEREAKDVQMDDYSYDIDRYQYSGNYAGKVLNGSLKLETLSEAAIREIIKEYIAKQNSSIDVEEEDLELILKTLYSVDREYRRPLYVLFIADAYINIEDYNTWDRDDALKELAKWDRNDALNYLLGRELQRLSSLIGTSGNHLKSFEKDNYQKAIEFLYALATYQGSIVLSDYYDIISQLFGIPKNDDMLVHLVKEFGILAPEMVIVGWEPDLIGEYFCIDFLNKSFEEKGLSYVKNFIELVIDGSLSDYVRYSDMIYNDYKDIVCDCEWMKAIRNIEFPAKFNYVRKNLFRECLFLKNISLPEQISTIEIGAFRDCKNLERVIFPSSLEIIEKYAFYGCEGLVEAVPEDGKGKNPSIIRIDSFAFKDCISLEKVILPNSIQELGISAFENCCSLTDIVIPGKIEKLESSTFAGCKSLQRVNFEKSNNLSLGDSCFSGCEQLTNIKGYWRISAIDRDAFRNCISIAKLKFSKLKNLEGNAFSGCRSLKYVDLSECEINHISERLFFDCESLVEVVLPEDIKRVDDRSFYGCKNLERVNFGNNITTIGRYAFSGCKKLKTLDFPATLCTVKSHAFENCTDLSAIFFASKPKTIEDHAFSGCESLSFLNTFGLSNIGEIEFCGFTFTSFSLSEFEFVKTYLDTENVVIPDTVRVIGNDVFLGARDDSGTFVNETIKTVMLSSSVEKIGNRAFMGCVNLWYVKCLNNIRMQIGSSAFSGCTSLQNIEGVLPVDEICDSTFQNCSLLEKIDVSVPLNKIGQCAFKGCQNLKYINIKGRRMPRYIGMGAFEGCHKLTHPIDPRLINKYRVSPRSFFLEGFVFKRITSKELSFLRRYILSEIVDIPDSCINIDGVEFNKIGGAKKIIIPESIRKLSNGVFKGCTKLESVELPAALSYIPSNAFENCKSLKEITFRGQAPNTIPHGVRIGGGAFKGCKKLKNIELPDDLEEIKSSTFFACSSLPSIRIPENVRTIGNFAFRACISIRTIALPETLTSLGKGAFSQCIGLTDVSNMENTRLTIIANNTFESCSNLETLKLPKGVKVIKGHAFENCHSLRIQRNFLPNGISVIEDAVFQGCYKIEIVRLPRSIKKIGDYTFKNCSSLKEIIIPKEVSYIGQSAFYHCNSLVDIKLPSELLTLGINAFAYCNVISKIEIPDRIKALSAALFKGCSSLEEVNIPEHIKEIPADAFKECISLKRISLPENLEVINVGAFRNCTSLEVKIPDNLKELRESAFRCCNNIEKISIPKYISKISSAAFEGCVRLKEVAFEHHINKVGAYAFSGCVSLERFPFTLVDAEIGDAAFNKCKALPSPLFSNGLIRIGSAAFRGCTNIKKLDFPLSMTAIYGASFRDNSKLESVIIPETVKVIKRSAFRDCVELREVCIDSSEITIESRSFKGCSNLDYIDIPKECIIQADAFEDCPVEIEIIENPEFHIRKPSNEQKKSEFVILEDNNTGDIILKRYIGSAGGIIVVPKEISKKKVVGIAESCFEEEYGITEVILPDSIEFIGENAFAYCKNLSKIILSGNICSIGAYAFKDCHNLLSIELPDKIKIIEKGTFMFCWKLEKVKLPDNLTTISDLAFLSCSELTLNFPKSVVQIGRGAFAKCDKNKIHTPFLTADDEWYE